MDPQVCSLPVFNMQQLAVSPFAQQQFNTSSSQNSNDTKVQGTIKRRNRLKPHQTKILTNFFLINPRPTPEERSELSKTVGMNIREIQVWFQNHRAKIKKEKDSPEEFNHYMPLTFSGNPDMFTNWQQDYNSLIGEFLPRDFELKNGSSTSIDSANGLGDQRYHLPIQSQVCANFQLVANNLNRLDHANNLHAHQPQLPREYSSEAFQPLSTHHYTSYDHKDPNILSNSQLDNSQNGELVPYNMYSAMTPTNSYQNYQCYGSNNNIMSQMVVMETPAQSPYPIYYPNQLDYSSTEATPMPLSQFTPLPYTPNYIQPNNMQFQYDYQNQLQYNDHPDVKTNSSNPSSSPMSTNLNSYNSEN